MYVALVKVGTSVNPDINPIKDNALAKSMSRKSLISARMLQHFSVLSNSINPVIGMNCAAESYRFASTGQVRSSTCRVDAPYTTMP
jgi:hypothetical protein